MISIIDYKVGNLRSLQKALEKLGYDAIITDKIDKINNSDAIILPGVGAFRDAIKSLKSRGLVECIKNNVKKGKPLLGICLGMQLLYDKSYEDGEYGGLGILPGIVVKIEGERLKVPHMGWNNLRLEKDSNILKYVKENDFVYFVHSYYVESSGDELIAWTNYGNKIPAVVGNYNVYGVQFHPEKSGKVGLSILKGFGELIK